MPEAAGIGSGSLPQGAVDRKSDFNDAAWVTQVQEGDEAAVCALVQRLYPELIQLIRYHLPPCTSEAELAQAVFAEFFAKLDRFSGRVPLTYRVARIAIRTCLNHLRHKSLPPELRQCDLSDEEDTVARHLAAGNADLPDELANAARGLLDKLLARLKPRERLVIALLHTEAQSAQEVSRLTGWSVLRVKVIAYRAQRKLRRLWGALPKGPEP